MKKSLSRILTLVLVLAMLVSVAPFALAAKTVESVTMSSATASVNVGKTVTLTATVNLTGELAEGETAPSTDVTWSSGDSSIATVSGGVVTGVAAGKATITAASVADPTKSATCEVTVSTVAVESVSIAGGAVGVGGSFTPTVTFTPADATNQNYTLSSSDTNISISGHVVTGIAAGPATVTVTTEDGSKEASCKIDVVDKHTIEASDVTMVVGEEKTLQATIKMGDDTVSAQPTAALKSGSDVVDLSGLTVTAKKAGTAVVTLSYGTTDANTGAKDVTITVSDAAIECANTSVAKGSSVTLTPKLTNVPDNTTDVTYSYQSTSGVILGAETGIRTTVTGKTEGLATVTVTATYKVNGVEKTVEKKVSVYVYTDHTVKVTVLSGVTSFDFEDKNVFSSAEYDGSKLNSSYDMATILSPGTELVGYLKLTEGSSSTAVTVGTISGMTNGIINWSALRNVLFTLNGKSGTQYIGYEILDTSKTMTLATGTIAITTGGYSGDITYSTDYNTAITFDEDDFEAFWNNSKSVTGTLKYVKFGVSATVPSYGELYTTASTTTRKVVSSAMMFEPNYLSSSSNYDLDTVTYVPSSTIKTAYTVEIPFTAYGGTAGTQALTGVVVIDLNTASTTITSRGVVFGNGLTSLIATDYKNAESTDLAYVTFYLPSVEDGRLYYNYTGIMDSTRVDKVSKYYVTPTSTQLALDKVAFIPAAGTTGKVTLYYTGYDKDGGNAYEGKLVLTVTAKTKSAIFTDVTTSYSWAADSVDFLSYEDVVNGTSSTTYSPANSITRGDFMLMLYRAFLEEDYANFNVTSNFADVVKGTSDYSKETYQAVGVAKYLGIAQGDGTNYNPKAPISREEAMTLIYRTLEEVNLDLEYTSSKTTASFSDYGKVSTYAQSSISYLIKHGVVIGSNGLINPKSNITRAEMAVILHRVLTY